MYTWSRYKKGQNDYECSSVGDKRLSALFAKLKDGRIIEDIYQLDIKGNGQATTGFSKSCCGKRQSKMPREYLWQNYLLLWKQYLDENPDLVLELLQDRTRNFTDCFAKSDISQARAIATILNQMIEQTVVVNGTKEQYDVFIGRGSKWGNPYSHLDHANAQKCCSRNQAIELYKVHLEKSGLLYDLPELVGKRLGCFCKPLPCHGDVLVSLIKGDQGLNFLM